MSDYGQSFRVAQLVSGSPVPVLGDPMVWSGRRVMIGTIQDTQGHSFAGVADAMVTPRRVRVQTYGPARQGYFRCEGDGLVPCNSEGEPWR